MAEARILVSGKVQGVFYRAFCHREATLLGVTGYAKNAQDGSIEIIAQGSAGAIQELLRRCEQGPPGAIVDDVSIQWRSSTEQFTKFMMR